MLCYLIKLLHPFLANPDIDRSVMLTTASRVLQVLSQAPLRTSKAMGAAAIPCLTALFEPHSTSLLSTDEACAFCSSLLEGVGKLEELLAQGPISLRWSTEAMNLLKEMQVQLLALLKECNLPISYGTEEDWFDQYMKDTAALLDFCNSVKSAISRITRYRMVVDLAKQVLGDADPSGDVAMEELEKVEREHKYVMKALKGTVRVDDGMRIGNGSKHINSISIVMLAAQSTMAAVTLLLTSATTTSVQINEESVRSGIDFPQLEPLVMAHKALTRRFKEKARMSEDGSGFLFLSELDMVYGVVRDLKTQAVEGTIGYQERFSTSVELLRTRAIGLKEGIEMFDAAVDEVFDLVIGGRNEMLGIFRDGALSNG